MIGADADLLEWEMAVVVIVASINIGADLRVFFEIFLFVDGMNVACTEVHHVINRCFGWGGRGRNASHSDGKSRGHGCCWWQVR